MRDGDDPMLLPCPYCGVDVQIEMMQLGRTDVIGPAGSAVHQANQQIIAGATHASPVCGSFDFADWFLMSLGAMPKASAKRHPKRGPVDPDAR